MEPVVIEAHRGRTVLGVDQKEYLYFAGTSYLGLNHQKDFQSHLKQGFDLFGTTYGNSRFGNIQLDILPTFEQTLKEYLQVSNLISFSSGYLAGQITCHTLAQHYQQVFISPICHPAVIPTGQKAFGGNWDEWLEFLQKQDFSKKTLIVTNCVNSSVGKPLDWEWVDMIPTSVDFLLDDSHGIGITRNGRGVWHEIASKLKQKALVIASLHKAMGLPAGIVYGNSFLFEFVKQHLVVNGASPILPAFAYAFCKNQEVLKIQQQKLSDLTSRFKELISENQLETLFESNDNYPVFVLSTPRPEDTYEYLVQNRVLVSAFRYPLASSPLRLRVVFNASHQLVDLEKIVFLLKNIPFLVDNEKPL